MSSGAGPASAAGAFVRSGERVPGRVRRRSGTSPFLPGAPIGPRCLVRGAAGRRVLLGHLGGQVGESSMAAGHGVDAQGMQAFAELGGSDGLAGNPAGEQPPGSGRESHPGVPGRRVSPNPETTPLGSVSGTASAGSSGCRGTGRRGRRRWSRGSRHVGHHAGRADADGRGSTRVRGVKNRPDESRGRPATTARTSPNGRFLAGSLRQRQVCLDLVAVAGEPGAGDWPGCIGYGSPTAFAGRGCLPI
jgi:hypothetical protein